MIVPVTLKELYVLLINNGIGEDEIKKILVNPDRFIKAIRNQLISDSQETICNCQGSCGGCHKCGHSEKTS